MYTFKTTDLKTIELRNQEVGGLLFTFILLGATAGTAISGTAVDLSKIKLKTTLHRTGERPKSIYNDLKQYHAILDSFSRSSFPVVFSGLPDANNTVVANGVGVVQKSLLPVFIDFGKTYVLRGEDKIVVEISAKEWHGATVDSDSYCEILELDREDIDDSDSEVLVKILNADLSSDKIVLGNGVTDILFVCLDGTDILQASAVIDSVGINSKQLNQPNMTYESLVSLRQLQFETVADATARKQNFMLHTGYPIDDVTLELSLNSANVNASKCAIVWRKQSVSQKNLQRGVEHIAVKQANTLVKAGLPQKAQEVVKHALASRRA